MILTSQMQALPLPNKIRKEKVEVDAASEESTTQSTANFSQCYFDITLPDMNELYVKDLAPVVEAAAPSMSDAGMNNDAMKSALKGIGLSLPKTMQQRCDPKKRIERLRSGGGKDITETAIMKGLNWLKSVQDEDGGWGKKDKDDTGKPVADRRQVQSIVMP